jgi:hypothetical protein
VFEGIKQNFPPRFCRLSAILEKARPNTITVYSQDNP